MLDLQETIRFERELFKYSKKSSFLFFSQIRE